MDEEKIFTLKDGRKVCLVFDGSSVIAYDSDKNKVGELGYNIEEGDYHHGIQDVLSIYNVDVKEHYRRQGIARECVLFAIERTGVDNVVAPHHTDTMKNNGNYLTGDGAALINSLRKDGIVSQHSNDDDPDW